MEEQVGGGWGGEETYLEDKKRRLKGKRIIVVITNICSEIF